MNPADERAGADGASTTRRRVPSMMLIVVVALIGGVDIGWAMGRGDDGLRVRDCFEIPSTGVYETTEQQSCNGVHDAEVLEVIELDAGTAWPGVGLFQGGGDAALACENALEGLRVNQENIPDDAQIGVLHSDETTWDAGGREVVFYTYSATGFPGPVLAG